MNAKEIIPGVVIIIFAIMVAVSITNYTSAQVEIESIKIGLEECSNLDGHKGDTIWQKDCSVYAELYYKNNE